MSNRVFVPASLPIKATDPLTWPRITITGDLLDVPGIGAVRIVHGIYVVGWRWRTSCELGCLAEFVSDGPCVRERVPWESPHRTLRGCIDGVDLALAARSSSGTPELYVATGETAAVLETLRLVGYDWGDADPTDESYALIARDGKLALSGVQNPSTAVHWLRRNLRLPYDWEQLVGG